MAKKYPTADEQSKYIQSVLQCLPSLFKCFETVSDRVDSNYWLSLQLSFCAHHMFNTFIMHFSCFHVLGFPYVVDEQYPLVRYAAGNTHSPESVVTKDLIFRTP